jgi:nucleoside-diphosphate-sugar epimerase
MGSLNDKRILITGGNGYLGSHLSQTLRNMGVKVHIIDLNATNNRNDYKVDITDRISLGKIVQEVNPQIIFHLAAVLNRERSFENHDHIMNVNYYGTINLLKALQEIEFENFIFASTSEVYGNNPAPFTESQIPDPCSPYSLSKVFCEQAIRTYSGLYKKNFTILRLFNFVGSNMPDGFFVPQLIHALQHNIPFNMTGGDQIRDYLYIDDVISALILAATNTKAVREVFNVCSGAGITLKDLVGKIKDRFNGDNLINYGALPYRENEIWNMVGDNNKIKQFLGFQPAYRLEETIEILIKSLYNG